MYEVVGAIEKNKDSLSQNLLFVMKSKFSPPMVKMSQISSLNIVLYNMPPAKR